MNLISSLAILTTFLLNCFVQAQETCLYDGCFCTQNTDNSIDIKCLPTLNTDLNAFPKRLNSSLNQTNVNLLLINKFSFETVPDDIFNGLKIKNLIFGQNSLKVLTRNAFRGVQSVAMLRFIENNLNFIEPGALDWLSDSLKELGLISLNITVEKLDNFFKEIDSLKNMHTFKLNSVKLTEFKSKWAKVIQNVSYLSLASNSLKNLSPNIFASFENLISLDLNQNLFNNFPDLIETIKPIAGQLRELKLNGNQIKELVEFPNFQYLELLDMSNNQLSSLAENIFENLTSLNYLYLSGNKLKDLEKSLFGKLDNLLVILLNNNFLTGFPNITNLAKLQILDMSNQHGSLKQVPDYAFERRMTFNSLSLILETNDLTFAGNKAFCSHYSNVPEIHVVSLSHRSVKNLNKCMLKQLKTSIVSRAAIKVEKARTQMDYSTVCTCDLRSFASSLRVDLLGACSQLNDKSCPETKNVEKDCSDTFDCY